jgi:hypothetical protein
MSKSNSSQPLPNVQIAQFEPAAAQCPQLRFRHEEMVRMSQKELQKTIQNQGYKIASEMF